MAVQLHYAPDVIRRFDQFFDEDPSHILTISLTAPGGRSTEYYYPFVDLLNDRGEELWPTRFAVDLWHRGVFDRADDGRFEPFEDSSRAEFLTWVIEAAGLRKVLGAAPFVDVSPSDPFNVYVVTAVSHDNPRTGEPIISGYDDGTNRFGPHDIVTRAQAAKIIFNAFAYEEIPRSASCEFSDVGPYHWGLKYVTSLCEHGAVDGFEDGTYQPDRTLYRAEAAAMIAKQLRAGGGR